MNNSQGNQSKNKNQLIIQFLRGDFFGSASRFGVKTYFVQHISQWSLTYLNDTDIASCADDNTLYQAYVNVDAVAETLKMSAEKLFKYSIV